MTMLEEENMAEKQLVVGSIKVLHDVKGSGFDQIKKSVAMTESQQQSMAKKVLDFWSDIADDSIITPVEKVSLKWRWEEIQQSYASIIADAESKNIDDKDYILAYKSAYQDLRTYLLTTIKVFDSMAENTEINPAVFNTVFNNYYQYEMLAIGVQGGTSIVEPVAPVNISAVAHRDYIDLSCDIVSNSVYNIQKYVIFNLYKDNVLWKTVRSQSFSARYAWDRGTDRYPEKTDLDQMHITVGAQIENHYGLLSDESSRISLNTQQYGTWLLDQPTCNHRTQDRTVILNLAEPPASNRERYGNTQYRVSVKRHDDSTYFKPADNENPYPAAAQTVALYSTDKVSWYSDAAMTILADVPQEVLDGHKIIEDTSEENKYYYRTYQHGNEENYKDLPAVADGYVLSGDTYVQTMPLEGQAYDDCKNTTYQFRIVATNESGAVSPALEVSVTAQCTNIRDFVLANETAKAAFFETLSAISANLGVVTGGAFGDKSSNHIALSTFIDENNRQWYKGDVFFGDENQYFRVEPQVSGGVITGYHIELKAVGISFTNDGANIEKLADGTFIYDTQNLKRRLSLSVDGIEMQERASESASWNTATTVAKVTVDQAGNLIITNSTSTPEIAFGVSNANVYRFNRSLWYYDESGANSENLSGTVTEVSFNETWVSDGATASGAIVKSLASGYDTPIIAVGKSDKVGIGGFVLGLSGTAEQTVENAAKTKASGASLSAWGFTDQQIQNIVFEEIS